jgi:hypothetical protein
MDSKIFRNLDDSKEKLSLETFSLIFVVWIVGVLTSMLVLAAELLTFKRKVGAKKCANYS